jgi:hypothetical protein
MSWIWDQSAGTMTGGNSVYHGYSGHDLGKNNPSMQAAKAIGPLPRGQYKMTGIGNSPNTGPNTITLVQTAGDTCGRGDFRIHGDSLAHPGEASHGCIILPPQVRIAIWNSGDHALEVVA